MTRSIILSVMALTAEFMLVLHPLPNGTIQTVLCTTLLILYGVMLGVAYNKEYKLKDRIKALEDKVENNAEHIHKLSKKQSVKTIEYYTDEI